MPPPREPDPPSRSQAALGFDLVEWFHDPAFPAHLSRRHWRRLPVRSPEVVEVVLARLATAGARATFAVPDAIAARHPELVRAIAAAGHELAAAGDEPTELAGLPADPLAAALAGWDRARERLERLGGAAVVGARSPWPAPAGWREAMLARGFAWTSAAGPDDGAAWFAAWHFDPASPRLVGLPRRVLRAHEAPFAAAPARLAAAIASGARTPVAVALGLVPGAAPARPPAPQRPAPVVVSPPPDAPRLAVVVPLKDEAEGLPSLFTELDGLQGRLGGGVRVSFVFVDDGSTDATGELLQRHCAGRPDRTLVRHPHNRGVAAAIHSGIAATDAPFVASIDGDLSYDPAELGAMLALLDGADVVTASPYHPRGGVKNVPPWRLSLSRTLSWLYRRLLRSDVRTWTACFRVYRRAAVADLPLVHEGFLGTAELLVRVLRRSGIVREHPCVLEARLFGLSKMRILRTIRGHLRLLWAVARGRIS